MNHVSKNNNNNNNNNNKDKNENQRKNGLKKKQSGWETGVRVQREFLFLIFLLFASFLDLRKSDHRFSSGLKGKVDLCDESYAWTPKSWSFVKLHEVGNFPTCVISSLKSIYWFGIGLEAVKRRKFQSSNFWTECMNFYEFSGIFLDSPDLISGLFSDSSG